MGNIVNLRRHRRRKARAVKDLAAGENRAKFGRAKHERQLTAAKTDCEKKRLDSHMLDK